MPQAFGCMKSILEYVLNTQDSIVLSLKDEGKDYLMELSIHTPYQVEFFGKACYMPQNPYIYDPTSIYKIWISKENDMPYRYRREMQHSISEDICSDLCIILQERENCGGRLLSGRLCAAYKRREVSEGDCGYDG